MSESLSNREELGVEEEDERTIVNLLTDQIECANVILLNKTDMVDEEQLGHLKVSVNSIVKASDTCPGRAS